MIFYYIKHKKLNTNFSIKKNYNKIIKKYIVINIK